MTGFEDRQVAALSGGQRQRVAIARMLARDVELVIADEPTANLDPNLTKETVALFRRLAARTPVLIITHDPAVAAECDRTIVLQSAVPDVSTPSPSITAGPRGPQGRRRLALAVGAAAAIVIGAVLVLAQHHPATATALRAGARSASAPSPRGAGSTTAGSSQRTVTRTSVPKLINGTLAEVKPTTVVLSADGGNVVRQLKWSNWGKTAVGHGRWGYLSCNPDCAASTPVYYSAVLVASDVVAGHYTRLFEKLAGPHGGIQTYNYDPNGSGPPWLGANAANASGASGLGSASGMSGASGLSGITGSTGTYGSGTSGSSQGLVSAAIEVADCNTTFGAGQSAPPSLPNTVAVTVPAALSGQLADYTDQQGIMQILGPSGWDCQASYGGDGSGGVSVYPPSETMKPFGPPPPEVISGFQTLCSSCVLAQTCGLFSQAAQTLASDYPGQQCYVPSPEESHYAISATAVAFEDPPGAAGTGRPSGGQDPANGVVTYVPHSSSWMETCTLPARYHSLCTASLNYFTALYGAQ